jgi:spore maturation protein CgeB
MGRAVVELLGDGERRQALAANALKAVRASFTLDRQVDAYLDAYHEIAQRMTAVMA